jgi:glutathione S-transferase
MVKLREGMPLFNTSRNCLTVLFNFYKFYLGEHMGDEFGKINPFRKVPVIDDNGFKLTER